MSSGRPKVGELFRSAQAPDRTVALAGLLKTSASSPEPEHPQQEIPSQGTSRPTRRPRPAPVADRAPRGARLASEFRIVPVVLDVSVLDDLRAFASRMELTYGAVALRAIEANSEHLQDFWRNLPAERQSGSLFSGTTALKRRAETGTQTQLRISESDAETLDRLVGEWAAPSRSALVNEALRRYIRRAAQEPGN